MIERLLARIGLDRAPAADVDGLFRVHRAFLGRVPYEDLAVQLGETAPLDEAALTARLLQDGRGGYCFELNTVLAALLRSRRLRRDPPSGRRRRRRADQPHGAARAPRR